MNAIALPRELEKFAGALMDVDSHEQLPAQVWVERLGKELAPFADYYMEHGELEEDDGNADNIPDYPGDVLPVDLEIGNVKGCRAPGAVDLTRRVEVMEALGVGRQLMYPTQPAAYLFNLYKFHDDPTFMSFITGDRRALAKRCIDLHNEVMIAAVPLSDRIRPVPVLFGDTPAEMITRARDFIARGIRAVWLFPAGELPGGVSPAHPDLDPLWSLMAAANCAVTLHIAGDGKFLQTLGWQDAPVFDGYIRHGELNRSPWNRATVHLPFENMLQTMILGGVFDRHPMLRFGVIECGSYWAGSMIRRLDIWHNLSRNNWRSNKGRIKGAADPYRLPEPPSFYLKRNVRITPFVFEDAAWDIRTFGLEDVLCFSTDYPHIEGGKGAAKTFYENVASLGEQVVEKFFVTNGAWLLPD